MLDAIKFQVKGTLYMRLPEHPAQLIESPVVESAPSPQ